MSSNEGFQNKSHYLNIKDEKREKNDMIYTYPSLSSTYINYNINVFVFDKLGINFQFFYMIN